MPILSKLPHTMPTKILSLAQNFIKFGAHSKMSPAAHLQPEGLTRSPGTAANHFLATTKRSNINCFLDINNKSGGTTAGLLPQYTHTKKLISEQIGRDATNSETTNGKLLARRIQNCWDDLLKLLCISRLRVARQISRCRT